MVRTKRQRGIDCKMDWLVKKALQEMENKKKMTQEKHLKKFNEFYTYCGVKVHGIEVTLNENDVTCKKCLEYI